MTRRRRAILLLALAALLGSAAATSVRRREAALERALGPSVPVLVTRTPIPAGAPLAAARPVLRAIPQRFAPVGALASATALAGARAAVALPAGAYLTAATLRAPDAALPPIGRGERIAQVVAHADPAAVVPGARVDVLVTRDGDGGSAGATVLALEDVEVLAARAAPPAASAEQEGASRVAASLRVSVRQAVYLAAAQSFARDVQLLARAPGDRAAGRAGLTVDERLR
jgi:pilus assembly protein CpaB